MNRQDNVVVLAVLVRQAIDNTHWKHAAIAVELGIDPPYLAKLLSGEKPMHLRHLQRLPLEVQCEFARLHAEIFRFIVVRPVTQEEGYRQFVVGLLTVLLGQPLPVKAALRPDATAEVA